MSLIISSIDSIASNFQIGTTVASVFARDLDIGLNGEVAYSLDEQDGAKLVQIHSSTGLIQTAQHLDRELMNIIRVYIYATDKGVPPMTSRALLEIFLLDVNDNAPVFEKVWKPNFRFSVVISDLFFARKHELLIVVKERIGLIQISDILN